MTNSASPPAPPPPAASCPPWQLGADYSAERIRQAVCEIDRAVIPANTLTGATLCQIGEILRNIFAPQLTGYDLDVLMTQFFEQKFPQTQPPILPP